MGGEEKVEKIPRGTIGDVDLSARYEVQKLPISNKNTINLDYTRSWIVLSDNLLEEFFQINNCDYEKYKKDLAEQTSFTIGGDKNYIIDITNVVPWKNLPTEDFPFITENGKYEVIIGNADMRENLNIQFIRYNLTSKQWEFLSEGEEISYIDFGNSEISLEYLVKPFLNISGLYNDDRIPSAPDVKREFVPWKELFSRQYLVFNEKNEVVYNKNFTGKSVRAPEPSLNPVSPYFNQGSLIIPNGITLGPSAFNGFTTLFYVELPNGITEIPQKCFENCTHTKVKIPKTVKKIHEYAFNGNFGVDYKIPNSVTYIGTNAFKRVTTIYYSGTATGSPWGAQKVLPNPDET